MYRAYENPTPAKPSRERNSTDATDATSIQVEPGSGGPPVHPQQPRANVGDPTPLNSFPKPNGPSAQGGIPLPTQPQAMPHALCRKVREMDKKTMDAIAFCPKCHKMLAGSMTYHGTISPLHSIVTTGSAIPKDTPLAYTGASGTALTFYAHSMDYCTCTAPVDGDATIEELEQRIAALQKQIDQKRAG